MYHIGLSTGVPQASILGLFLFIIHNNDLCNASILFKMIIYAMVLLYAPNWMFLVIIPPKIYN